ncbi:BTB/POZ domain-containing protein 3-like [Argiope bruennichi]|uniref:BTB/POZ domain-containing protein 3 n=1 Tax=Argiope bruennichi TaxID=94029 RepID=A0A8T0EFZ1_ARGBR|nr:BTB/POZ domain-containing protein 3-like [Argiope bruennichi]KAF8770318.1 BTB/POZ domain-containing protein 3 [Argiope bruennichi]
MRIALDAVLGIENETSEGKIIKFPFLNDDWRALNEQENSDMNNDTMVLTDQEDCEMNSVDDFSESTGLNFKPPASYDQWMSMESFENGLQIILKDDQNAVKDNALDCFESDWRAVLERYLFASENSFLPDVTLELGHEKTLFHVHKFILALGCDVFKAMFYGPLAEKGEQIGIPDVSPKGFKVLLRYFYGALIVLTNVDEAKNTWIVADKYCVEELKEECENFFRCCPISSKNVWKLYDTALFIKFAPLICRCKRFIHKHTEASLSDESFLEAKLQTLQELFNLPILRVNELLLMKSLVHWGRNQVQIGYAYSLRAALRHLLPNFHFCALTPVEFCKFLDYKYDVLDELDALAILKHLTKPLVYPLPEWCAGIECSKAHESNKHLYSHRYLQKTNRASKKLKRQHSSSLNHYYDCL